MLNILVPCLLFTLYPICTVAYNIKRVQSGLCNAIESIVWDDNSQLLYFVDIFAASVYRFDEENNVFNFVQLPGEDTIGSIRLIKGEKQKFVVGAGKTIYELTWNGSNGNGTFKSLGKIKEDGTDFLNDAIADPDGRLVTGTLALKNYRDPVPNTGALYVVTIKKGGLITAEKKLSNFTFLNGFGLNKNNTLLYYSDGVTGKISRIKYDAASGSIIGAQEDIFDISQHDLNGLPDGMAFDTEGNLWIALNMGYKVIRINPTTRKLLQTIELPFRDPTGLGFGGAGFKTLFVGSSRMKLNKDERKKQPGAGALHAITGLNVAGVPPHRIVFR